MTSRAAPPPPGEPRGGFARGAAGGGTSRSSSPRARASRPTRRSPTAGAGAQKKPKKKRQQSMPGWSACSKMPPRARPRWSSAGRATRRRTFTPRMKPGAERVLGNERRPERLNKDTRPDEAAKIGRDEDSLQQLYADAKHEPRATPSGSKTYRPWCRSSRLCRESPRDACLLDRRRGACLTRYF